MLKSKNNEKFKLFANGCEDSFFEIENLSQKKKSSFFCNQEIVLQEGLNQISGFIYFKGPEWSLSPEIKENSNLDYISAFKLVRIFKENHFLLKNNFKIIFKFFSKIFVLLICLIPFSLLILKIIHNNNFRKYFIIGFLFFLLFITVKHLLINYLNYSRFDGHQGSIISISVLIFFSFFLILNNKIKFIDLSNLNFKYLYFIIFAPVTLFFYYKSNVSLLNQIPSIGWDDDWHFFEFFLELWLLIIIGS